MGCDIHGVFQVSNGDEWVTINSPYDWERDYLLFGFLANVRDRSCYHIDLPRGLPEDFPVFLQHEMPYHILGDNLKYRKAYGEKVICMGEHSFSRVTFREVFEHRPKFLARQLEIEEKHPGYLKFHGSLEYFFKDIEETMKWCGIQDTNQYRMVFGFDS